MMDSVHEAAEVYVRMNYRNNGAWRDPVTGKVYDSQDRTVLREQIVDDYLAELDTTEISPTPLELLGFVCTQAGSDGFRFKLGECYVGLRDGIWSFGSVKVQAHGIKAIGHVRTLLRLSKGCSE